MKFEGSYVAVVTPFKGAGIDTAALKRLTAWHVQSGTSGIVACGSTGEAATLKPDEAEGVLKTVAAEAKGKLKVVAGVGTNATAKSVEQARHAAKNGADALLALVPYYNKPTQEGLYRHFSEIAESVDLPIIVYNIPGRTGVNLLPKTLARLAKARRNIIATKEAAGSLDQVSEILTLLPRFCVLSGDDSLTLPMMSVGASGVISVVANIAPKETAALCRAALDGDFGRARELHLRLFPLVKALFMETNPIPVKTAMGLMGLCDDGLRLPLCELSKENLPALKEALDHFGLLKKK
jgi:4-hydroxy-tetrahydrodipicolinate synthase